MAREKPARTTAAAATEPEAPVVARTEGARLRVRLRELRGERSLSEAAEMIGIRADELGRIERGSTTQIRFSTLLRILAAYQCSPDSLLEVERDAPDQARYAGALGAFLAGDLPRPSRRGTPRQADVDEQDMAEAAAFAEPADASRPTRPPVGTLHR